jgi:hypothetical protein
MQCVPLIFALSLVMECYMVEHYHNWAAPVIYLLILATIHRQVVVSAFQKCIMLHITVFICNNLHEKIRLLRIFCHKMCNSAVSNTIYRTVEEYQIPHLELTNIKYKNLYFSWMCNGYSDAVQERCFTLT